jgi:hypothetical protein
MQNGESKMRELELAFTPDHVELVNKESEEIEWASDDDDDFRDDFGDELLNADEDGERVILWLKEMDIISDEEADDIEIFDESGSDDEIDENVIEGELDDEN